MVVAAASSSFFASLPLPHEHLPPPFNDLVAKYVLFEDYDSAEFYLLIACGLLTVLAFVQLKAFARPPPVPLKKLPKRPTLSILFKPDDITSKAVLKAGVSLRQQQQQQQRRSSATSATKPETATTSAAEGDYEDRPSMRQQKSSSQWRKRIGKSLSSATSSLTGRKLKVDDYEKDDDVDDDGLHSAPPLVSTSRVGGHKESIGADVDVDHDDDIHLDDEDDIYDRIDDDEEDEDTPFVPSMDLPDSFAPLLSSSQVEVLTEKLTADLIHAVQCEGGVRMRGGRHEIPLDKDSSRPQLLLDVPKTGCRISAVAMVGSDGFSSEEDLDTSKATSSRSTPMVKNAGVVFDPPLPLSNVAPTLIHFPTLFEDNVVPTLRRIIIVRLFMDFIVSASAFIERCLWILESKCQIHLAKVRVVPLYKGHSKDGEKAPDWRLSLSFSGHLLLFGWIPFPFISVTLPTLIIPQPHALLKYLLSKQPLASARIRRENIAERRIALALIGSAETWTTKVSVVATPPAVAVDLFLAGGVSCAVECELGRDPLAGRSRNEAEAPPVSSHPATSKNKGMHATDADNSMSSWTTNVDQPEGGTAFRQSLPTSAGSVVPPAFDAIELVPWKIELSAKGAISHEKMSVHVLKFAAEHEGIENGLKVSSRFKTRGSLAVWKYRSGGSSSGMEPIPLIRKTSRTHRKSDSFGRSLAALSADSDTPSVAAVFLFPEETESFRRDMRMLEYDYAFDVFEDSKLDAVTVTVAATHPMLKGGTLITAILDSIYAYGSVAARDDALLDPEERKRKRNILRHLPATDFTLGVNNVYIPTESYSYSDDGLTLFVPEASGGRMVVRLLGGMDGVEENSLGSNVAPDDIVTEGIKLVADFTVPSLILRTEGIMKEFPELDVSEGVNLRSYLSGITTGSVRAHLRPQKVTLPMTSTGRNIFNPLEAYEVDFAKSQLSVKVKEYNISLGHRRIVFPSESTVVVKIIDSVVDMVFEGKTKCELSWDFQGLSPILQVTRPGKSPAEVTSEDKEQAPLLVAPLRQGRFSLNVSSVGGISITKAATSREDKEGLYDWKFFNALVSPDSDSPGRLVDVLNDKRTMERLLQIAKLVNKDLYRLLRYTIRQVWRAKEIFDAEGITDPGHLIPMYKMARLISLFMTGDLEEVDRILPIVDKVVKGDGLDVVAVKELLRNHLDEYDDWAPELDRAVRWAAVAFGPMTNLQPNAEEVVKPLAEIEQYQSQFKDIPSASQLYESLLDKPQFPLDPAFSSLVSRVAPYLSFQQIEFFLEARSSSDWQPADLRRIRYIYSIKRKCIEIAESYGGLSFLPQSFLVSVFLGEATRTVLRAPSKKPRKGGRRRSNQQPSVSSIGKRQGGRKPFGATHLRRRHVPKTNIENRLTQVAEAPTHEGQHDEYCSTPAERIDLLRQFDLNRQPETPRDLILDLKSGSPAGVKEDTYELGDSLLGPQDVAILLQAGLTSVMKSSTVVQLNQRMLLDLICSQPRSFAIAVLAEIGSPSGHGDVRGLTMALMAFLELDQTAFKPSHQIDMHALLASWLPGLKIPLRSDYLAGGRWARQSYYQALYSVATSILEDAESYAALKCHLQRVRKHKESDPIPQPRDVPASLSTADNGIGLDLMGETPEDSAMGGESPSRLRQEIVTAQVLIEEADAAGRKALEVLFKTEKSGKGDECKVATRLYNDAFAACARVLALDKHAFHAQWFHDFYRRNYDALMIKSMVDNVVNNVDNVRYWLHRMLIGAKKAQVDHSKDLQDHVLSSSSLRGQNESLAYPCGPSVPCPRRELSGYDDDLFLYPEKVDEQLLIDAILDSMMYEDIERECLRRDPLLRLLIPNPPGNYSFTIVSAMGVVTEGKQGLELIGAFDRLEKQRGVKVIRSDTATARSLEYNALKIEEAIEAAVELGKPYGYIGYSQGCANALMAETMLLSGTPRQQKLLNGLVCRQLLFSAANGSFHGPSMDKKIKRLIVMCEEFFKYQQGYASRAMSSLVLETLNTFLDSSNFHKIMGGAQSFLPDGCRAFWREAQQLPHVPTCTLRAVMEEHTTPECLEMISHLLAKQSGSPLHDSQVHVFDAVGHPIYHHNRNGKILKACDIGNGAVQRSHHWSPLSDEVEFVRTVKDVEMASFDCAKDRHVFPWVDVNVRFGFIQYMTPEEEAEAEAAAENEIAHNNSKDEWHPAKLVEQAASNSAATLKS